MTPDPPIQVHNPEDLMQFLWRHAGRPDETVVEASFLAYSRRVDGSYGPPGMTLGQLRYEATLRAMFPYTFTVTGA